MVDRNGYVIQLLLLPTLLNVTKQLKAIKQLKANWY
jgi:hypothetical protein